MRLLFLESEMPPCEYIGSLFAHDRLWGKGLKHTGIKLITGFIGRN